MIHIDLSCSLKEEIIDKPVMVKETVNFQDNSAQFRLSLSGLHKKCFRQSSWKITVVPQKCVNVPGYS